MAVYNPNPLSMAERMKLACAKREEAKLLIDEAERIEKGIADDNELISKAVEKIIKEKEE